MEIREAEKMLFQEPQSEFDLKIAKTLSTEHLKE